MVIRTATKTLTATPAAAAMQIKILTRTLMVITRASFKLIIGELFSPLYTICLKKYYIKLKEVVCFKVGWLGIANGRP
jgi:hypothetical protein